MCLMIQLVFILSNCVYPHATSVFSQGGECLLPVGTATVSADTIDSRHAGNSSTMQVSKSKSSNAAPHMHSHSHASQL